MSDVMLQEYRAHRSALESLAAKVHGRIEALLAESQVPVSFVSWRLKDPKSLAHKLARPEKSYHSLWDVTDLVGVRVSVSFEDHVEVVSRLIEKHFQVDFGHSVERVRPAGYRSLHYVCAHAEAPHPAFRFEVQVRTALQHAWAEMEHDLGYKVNDAVPEAIRRRFARVAGLLEIADQEFVSIRRDLESSRETAQRTLAKNDGDLPIDLVSLEALVRRPPLEALDGVVARSMTRPLGNDTFFPDYLVGVLQLCGLGSTQAVLHAVERHASDVPAVLPRYLEFANRELGFDAAQLTSVERGYGLLFVAQLHVVRGPELGLSKVARLTRLYQQLEFPEDERRAHRVASGLVATLG